jgi:hypothetical protein
MLLLQQDFNTLTHTHHSHAPLHAHPISLSLSDWRWLAHLAHWGRKMLKFNFNFMILQTFQLKI